MLAFTVSMFTFFRIVQTIFSKMCPKQTLNRRTINKKSKRYARCFKGTVQRDFRPPYFSSFEPAWATDQWVKIFHILVKMSTSYRIFRGIILRRVDLRQNHTAQSRSPRSIILRCGLSVFSKLRFENSNSAKS